MKTKYLLSILIALFVSDISAQNGFYLNLFPDRKCNNPTGDYWLMDTHGNLVTIDKFDRISPIEQQTLGSNRFTMSASTAFIDGRYTFIDTLGNMLYKPLSEKIYHLINSNPPYTDFKFLYKNNKWGFLIITVKIRLIIYMTMLIPKMDS